MLGEKNFVVKIKQWIVFLELRQLNLNPEANVYFYEIIRKN